MITEVQRRGKQGKTVDYYFAFVIGLICSAISQYLQLHQKGMPICAFRYDDLLENPNSSLEVLFKYCDIHLNLVPKGLAAMSLDSQRGSYISRDNSKSGCDIGTLAGQKKELLENIYKIFNIPSPGGMLNLPGTINTYNTN